MTRFTSAIFALAVALGVGFTAPAQAQSTQDMSVLTQEERAEFSTRLQQAKTSAERARITAEMNILIQQRKLEQRRNRQNQPDDDAGRHEGADQGQGQGKSKGKGKGHADGGPGASASQGGKKDKK